MSKDVHLGYKTKNANISLLYVSIVSIIVTSEGVRGLWLRCCIWKGASGISVNFLTEMMVTKVFLPYSNSLRNTLLCVIY